MSDRGVFFFRKGTAGKIATHSTANKKYLKEHGRRVTVCLTTPSDDDILAKLETVESKSGYIKQLIRTDISARKKSN